MNDRYSRFIAGTLLAGSFTLPVAEGIICDTKPVEFLDHQTPIVQGYEKECHISHPPHDHREIFVYDSTSSTVAQLSASVTGSSSVIGGINNIYEL